jgi:hypothetical protein
VRSDPRIGTIRRATWSAGSAVVTQVANGVDDDEKRSRAGRGARHAARRRDRGTNRLLTQGYAHREDL